MHAEILDKLKTLLDSDDILAVRGEFNSLKSQFLSLPLEHPSEQEKSDPDAKEARNEDGSASHENTASKTTEQPAAATDTPRVVGERDVENAPVASRREAVADAQKPETAKSAPATNGATSKPMGETPAAREQPTETADPQAEEVVVDPKDRKSADTETASEDKEQSAAEPADEPTAEPQAEKATKDPKDRESTDAEAASEGAELSPQDKKVDDVRKEFDRVVKDFNAKVKEVRSEKEKVERETVAQARELLEELKAVVADEENIGKAFSRFNGIQERWKALPKVSDDAYRDLNVEYNKYLEEFFYNINIYKELKELDLKRNLEEKQAVLADQKKLLEQNDIRLLEIQVRDNQDRWNEIGPTFREEWVKIKDDFWNTTRQIYARIHDFYQDRRQEQEKNLVKKKELLETARQIADLELKSTKKWHEKSEQIKDLQKQWRMIGFVPKKDAREINREFRKICDGFFDRKRTFHAELKKVQDANRDAKEEMLARAEALKDSEDWAATSKELIGLQKKWKSVGPAFQRDENRLWKKFRAACNHFFNRRNEHRDGRGEREKENLEKKRGLIEELRKLDVKEVAEPIEVLKEFHGRWRAIGHVPIQEKKAVEKQFDDLMDEKYEVLDIDRGQRRRLQFEEHVETLKEKNKSDHLIRKEEDIVRSKISKLESEIHQLENNMGFFADTKGAEEFKKEINKKIETVRTKIHELEEQMNILRSAY